MAASPMSPVAADVSASGRDRRDPMEWPASPWPASAPESHLLLHFSRPDAKYALKLAVLELVARGWLQLVEAQKTGLFGRAHKEAVLSRGRRAGGGFLLPALLPLWRIFDGLGPKSFVPWQPGSVAPSSSEWQPPAPVTSMGRARGLAGAAVHKPVRRRQPRRASVSGVEVRRFALGVVRKLGSVDGYVAKVVRPVLVDRGWVAGECYRVLGVFPSTRWVLTPQGVAAQGDLLWRVDYGNRELGRLVDDAPDRAIAFAGLAGAALLLAWLWIRPEVLHITA